ncbi:alpha/beta hydrolase [Clostridium estertheticum]|uniref:alpha/beta hydrolase n=1 Tax=Clostridium estertheticum TaxID=238834 RepID=UPI001CF51A4F|nr:alpha/beta fold hydrolase [Clostridium estertheticum]MCB2309389.1 alpha/beta hydrolase [Clostridium estertheticum]MCB2347836.1 alpha/beta hydrolase [Clostridium estertheticum]MCB2352346.1 alpha/beta hydrolase [Clostridium estertheticum]WAG48318.1 alpha/beta hydrolase [Clostridium estertheticum]
MIKKKYDFPVGWHDIHPDMSFNFQMNRFYGLTNDPSMLEEMCKVSPSLHTYPDYIQAFMKLSNESLQKNEKLKAALYLRGAEFFINTDDPEKILYRNKFVSLVREHYGINENQYYRIPYETGFLSAYRFTPQSPKGTIVIFGGYDSYIEEFFPMLLAVRDSGYDVVCFEGPGQGSPLEDYKLPMINEWEKPVKAILDYFNLDDVTLMGISLGGYLVIRAAAYEKRVKRVIADGAITDFYNALYHSVNSTFHNKIDNMIETNDREGLNVIFDNLMKENLLMKWAVKQGMHITGSASTFEYIKVIKSFVSTNISPLLTQDVLLMAAQNDHYIPIYQFYDQIHTLTNVRSLTARLFTKAECAQNHCHVGNIGLSIDVIMNWLDNISQ